MEQIVAGDIVISLRGRDTDKIYIVSMVEKEYVFLVDGRGKTIDKPKKKSIKHIRNLNKRCEILAEKFKLGKKVLDAEIRKYVKLVDLT